jgi:hypothetical protein
MLNLIAITRPFTKGVIWVNPQHVLSVAKTNIGHKNQGVIGTSILLQGMNPIETAEAIESVIQRLQGGA